MAINAESLWKENVRSRALNMLGFSNWEENGAENVLLFKKVEV